MITTLIYILLVCITGVVLVGGLLKLILRSYRPKQKTIGFFHPYCNDGGGGERVLWMMVEAISDNYPGYKILIYSGDREVTREQILQKVKDRFAIDLTERPVGFCFLKTRQWVEASRYPVFTMLGQSLGATILAIDALTTCNPHIFFDSMGYSFTYWVCRIFGGCKVGAYVHYPTISTDMLQRVRVGGQTYNNRRLIAKIPLLQQAKLIYYQMFALLYGVSGRAAQTVFVNSSWTKAHIDSLWKIPHRTRVLYPPCNCVNLSKLPLGNRTPGVVISIAQFRPEKDHALQIRAIATLLQKYAHIEAVQQIKLVLIGSCRNQGDEQRITALKSLAEQLGVTNHIQFAINVTFEELKHWYSTAQFGLHTMWCEHFGIGVVELMASGVIVIAHNSGGPRCDIVVPHNNQITGCLASTAEEYADKLAELLQQDSSSLERIQVAARVHSRKFSDENFKTQFLDGVASLLRN